ncbi:MAG: peptidoglycan-binding domain-containing protein, partial [Solirubrobacteraceae bacterium]
MSYLDFRRIACRAGTSILIATAAIGATSAAAATTTQPASGGAAMQATVKTAGTLTRPSTINQLGRRILRPGLHGNDVTVLQGYLTIAGFPTSVDGDFGPDTGTSVAAFKQAHNIAPANDVAGPSFDTALKAAISAQ